MAINLGRTRLLLFENAGNSIPLPFLLVLVFWFTIIFASFGLFAPRNVTAIAALLVSALSVSGAIFLILELDRSFERILQVSSVPLRESRKIFSRFFRARQGTGGEADIASRSTLRVFCRKAPGP